MISYEGTDKGPFNRERSNAQGEEKDEESICEM